MGRIIHFEINADDPEKAAEFYKNVFGWEIKKWGGEGDGEPYWLVMTGPKGEPGIDGGLMKRHGDANSFVNIVAIENIDESMKKVEKEGGKITSEKMDVPEVGWVCYCEDTEGNKFGLIEPHGKM